MLPPGSLYLFRQAYQFHAIPVLPNMRTYYNIFNPYSASGTGSTLFFIDKEKAGTATFSSAKGSQNDALQILGKHLIKNIKNVTLQCFHELPLQMCEDSSFVQIQKL